MRLCRAQFVLVMAILCCLSGPRALGVSAIYRQTIPMVLDASGPEDTVLEVRVDGDPTAVKLWLASTGVEVPMRDCNASVGIGHFLNLN